MSRYQVWDKTSDVYTLGRDKDTGKNHYTAAEWIEKYPWINIPTAVPVIATGIYNGGFIGELSELVKTYAYLGADFSTATTDAEKLAVIEAFEDAQNTASANATTVEERTAAALEVLALATLPDVE